MLDTETVFSLLLLLPRPAGPTAQQQSSSITLNEDAEFVITCCRCCCCCCCCRQAQERNNIRVPLKQQHGGRYTRTGSTTAAHGNTPGREFQLLRLFCFILLEGGCFVDLVVL
jgi:hypothetical protein